MVANLANPAVTSARRRLDDDGQKRAGQFMPLAFKLAYRQFLICGGLVPHDELRSEALCALVYACSMFDEEKGVPFRAYATMAIKHYLINAVTRWRRRESMARFRIGSGPEAQQIDVPCRWSREAIENTAAEDMIERVRAVLPKRYYEVLRLYFLEELTMDEVGARLGVTRERVRQLIAAAFMRVRRRFPNLHWN